MDQPKFYTIKEGGDWIPWPDDAPILTEEGLNITRQLNTSHIFEEVVWFKGMNMPVHSLAFDDPVFDCYKSGFRRWDCINGWTGLLGREVGK